MKWLVIFKGSNGQYAILVDHELSETDAIEQARCHVFVLDDDELVEAIPVIWAAL